MSPSRSLKTFQPKGDELFRELPVGMGLSKGAGVKVVTRTPLHGESPELRWEKSPGNGNYWPETGKIGQELRCEVLRWCVSNVP